VQRRVLILALPLAFAAGWLASHGSVSAWAADTRLTPQMIDLAAMTEAEIGPLVPGIGTLRSRTLVADPEGSVAVQSGDVPRHTHTGSDEIQYVVSGSGSFWLGGSEQQVHPGDIIIIPRGTVHAGSHVASGRLRVISIKLPPQAPGDFHLVP